MPGPGSVACPKPPKRKTIKGRKDRAESALKRKVRQIVADRDGYCRLAFARYGPISLAFFGPCSGPSEWSHCEEKRRGKTRGMDASDRHTSAGSFMLCREHHQGKAGYDRHGFRISYLSARGCDGPLRYVKPDGDFFDEPDRDS